MSFFQPLPKKIKFLTFFIAILAAISCVSFVYADNYQWTVLTSSSSNSNWESIAVSSDGTYAYAVRSDDYIYTSNNSGVNWVQTGYGPYNWKQIATAPNGGTTVAIPVSGSPFMSTDYGSTWTPSSIGSGTWNSVAVSDTDDIAIADTSGQLFISRDNGNSFTDLPPPDNGVIQSVAFSPDGDLVVGNDWGYIYTSTDDGSTWHLTNAPLVAWNSVAASNSLGTIVAGSRGDYIYISTDGGNSWNAQTGPGQKTWSSVAVSADGMKIVAASNSDNIFTSQNGGGTWLEETLAGSGIWNGVALTTDGTLLLAASSNSYLAKGNLISGNNAYFNAANGDDWNYEGNYWRDSSYTVPFNALPDTSTDVFVKANVMTNNGADAIAHSLDVSNDSSIGVPVTVNTTITVHDTSTISSTATSTGTITFDDNSTNGGHLIGDVIFNNFASNTGNGTITGDVTFNNTSLNADGGVIHGNTVFNDSAQNLGELDGNATFNGSSILGAGGVTGNATFNGDTSDIVHTVGYNDPIVTGTKIRRYTTNTTTTRDFTTNGPWTVIADGATVDITGATVDVGTTLSEINGGHFITNSTPGGGGGSAPTITSVDTNTPDGTYKAGDHIIVTVNFSANVTSTGNVTVAFDSGGSCSFSVSDAALGSCTYIVGSTDASSHLNVTSISGIIDDQSSNQMTDFTPATNLSSTSHIVIDTTNTTSTPVPHPPSGTRVNTADIPSTLPLGTAPLSAVQSIATKLRLILESLLKIVGQGNAATSTSASSSLPTQIMVVSGGTYTTSPSHTFTHSLKYEDIDPDVLYLQIYLNSHGFPVAENGPGSTGNETVKFGHATFVALIKFQRSVGISGSGFFGPQTMAYINSHQ